jgi:uncharacterized protein
MQLCSEVDMRMMSVTLVVVTALASVGLAKADAADGWKAFHAGDYAKAIKEFMPRVEQGDAAAQYWVGIVYYDERSDLQDYDEAEKWFRKAAEQGVVDAQRYLGEMYIKGRGVPQDFVLAHMWSNLAGMNGVKLGADNMAEVEKLMTAAQIADAQKLAQEWLAKHRE